jgi:hypothetical protein
MGELGEYALSPRTLLSYDNSLPHVT